MGGDADGVNESSTVIRLDQASTPRGSDRRPRGGGCLARKVCPVKLKAAQRTLAQRRRRKRLRRRSTWRCLARAVDGHEPCAASRSRRQTSSRDPGPTQYSPRHAALHQRVSRSGCQRRLQRFHRAFAPFEHLSLVVAQELRAGARRNQDRRVLERRVLNGSTSRADVHPVCQCLEPFRRPAV